MIDADSTLQDVPPVGEGNRYVVGRRVATAAVAVFVLLGLLGVLGSRNDERSTTQGDWTVTVTYAQVARAGLDVPFQIEVTQAGGLDPQIDLVLDRGYFRIYESQRFFPEPAEESSDAEHLYLTFDAPPTGDTLKISYDAYIQPSSQVGHDGTVAVLVDDVPTATVAFRTTLLP